MRDTICRLLTALTAGLLATACTAELAAADNRPSLQEFGQVERGRYLTLVADCGACHTDSGGKPFSGGRPIETPFGKVLAANITRDRETGIGNWSDAQFDSG